MNPQNVNTVENLFLVLFVTRTKMENTDNIVKYNEHIIMPMISNTMGTPRLFYHAWKTMVKAKFQEVL